MPTLASCAASFVLTNSFDPLQIPGGVPTEVNAHLGSSNLTALRFLADGDGVEAVWACGDEALNGTLLLSPPLMPIDGAVCSIDARDGGKLRTFEARGQMSIGSTSVSAIAKQEGDGRYGTVTAEFGGGGMQGVAVSDLLDAFGCADKDNVNQTWPWGEGGAGACEIPAGGGGLEDELKIMSIGGQGGGGGVLLAGYDSVGGGAGWYEAKGTPPSSLFDQVNFYDRSLELLRFDPPWFLVENDVSHHTRIRRAVPAFVPTDPILAAGVYNPLVCRLRGASPQIWDVGDPHSTGARV
jgi:hypothetical protein